MPPPPHRLPELLTDLEGAIHVEDDLPPLVRVGLLPVQFETSGQQGAAGGDGAVRYLPGHRPRGSNPAQVRDLGRLLHTYGDGMRSNAGQVRDLGRLLHTYGARMRSNPAQVRDLGRLLHTYGAGMGVPSPANLAAAAVDWPASARGLG